MHGRRPLLAALALALLTSGCRTLVTQEPDSPPPAREGSALRGTVEYEGNPLYLPRALALAEAGGGEGGPTFRLDYRVAYRHSSNAQILNPLLLFGARFVGTDVTATGRLEVRADQQTLATYERSCVVRLRRSVWVWEQVTTSDLRERALSCARDLLEADLDREAAQDRLAP